MIGERIGKPRAALGVDVRIDERFHCAYRPNPSGDLDRPLLIAVHGSGRDYLDTAAAFAAFAARADVSVLAPLFPAAAEPIGGDGYKFLHEPGVDYVALMDRMIDEARRAHRFDRRRVYLFGFSGGAQFAQRYALVRAGRLAGLILGAPGSVTLLDPDLRWWAGLDGIEESTGHAVDAEGLRRLAVHLLIGAEDRIAGVIERPPGSPYHSPYADRAGSDRRSRIEALRASLSKHGVAVDLEIVPGAGHELAPIAAAAIRKLEFWSRSGPRASGESFTGR